MPAATWIAPLLALAFYAAASLTGAGYGFDPSPLGIGFAVLLIPVLGGAVFAAVHHAEVIAHRTGEPYGTLVLTIAVTVIELALIASVPASTTAANFLASRMTPTSDTSSRRKLSATSRLDGRCAPWLALFSTKYSRWRTVWM
jgi:Ca2+/H+ antiporter